MADKDGKNPVRSFWKKLLPHAVWEVLRYFLAPVASVVITAFVALFEKARHVSLDWYFLGGLFVVSSGILAILVYVARRLGMPLSGGLATRGYLREAWPDAFKNPRWEIVSGHTFVNKSVEADGKSFRDCSFENVTFVFHGYAPTEFVGNTRVSGGLSFDTDHPAIMLYAKLQRMARAFPGARVKEGSIDEKGNLLTDNFGIRPVQSEKPPGVRQSEVLGTLPVYPDDLRLELLALSRGTTLDLSRTTLFLKLSLVSDNDIGLREMNVTLTIGDHNYSGKPLADLSEWIVRTPFKDSRYPYKSFEEGSLDGVSLWREVQLRGLKSGLVKVGWVGVQISDGKLTDQVAKVRIEIVKPQRREPYKFTFSQWADGDLIFDSAFRQP